MHAVSKLEVIMEKSQNKKVKFKLKWKWRYIPVGLIVILALAIGLYLSNGYSAMTSVKAFEQSNEIVQYTDKPWLEYTPVDPKSEVGIIFYPGGKVDPKSYLPLMSGLAEAGYHTIIVPMPFNLAIFSPNAADKIIEAYPDVDRWIIGGHSLGGVMGATYAYKHPDVIDGLFLLASYPQEKYSLANSNLSVLSICGTNDGFVNEATINDSLSSLPASTQVAYIEGGNHSQMGSYGFQKGDQKATISREEQHNQVIKLITEWIEKNHQ